MAKLLWLFLCDHCDSAGVVDISLKIASAKIGQAVKVQHLAELESRLHTLSNGKRFIRSFIRFQYGTLSPDCKPHASVISTLARHGIDLQQLDTLCKPYPKGIHTLQEKDQEKETDQDRTGSGTEGSAEGNQPPALAPAQEVLAFLNTQSGKQFRGVETDIAFIEARLAEPGVTLDGVKIMIVRQCNRWKGTEQAEYLRPKTLFNKTNFDSYYASKDLPLHEANQRNSAGGHRLSGAEQRSLGIPDQPNAPDVGDLLERKAQRDATA